LQRTPTNTGIQVLMPNKQHIRATHTCLLDLPALPLGARQAHLFPSLAYPLISIGLLCDHGCTALFDQSKVTIHHENKIILTGQRDPTTNLWTIPLTPASLARPLTQPTQHAAYNAYDNTTKKEHVTFLHASAGSPVPSTWIQAIDNDQYLTWPGLTADLVRKHLPKSRATVQGHLHQQRQNVRSTKAILPSNSDDLQPTSDSPNMRSHLVFASTIELRQEIATDLTGRFPVQSSRGYKYILVLYDFDSNAILTEPLRNRSEQEHIRAYNKLHAYLVDRGFQPQLQRLDNEASAAYKSNLRAKNIDFQLVPPHNHRRNAAERAIQTFKNHFVAILCGTDKQFPLNLWCRLLPQATTTLNLLRRSRLNPRLSADAHLNGPFDFNRTPMAPLGTKVILHETPSQRKTWATHGVDGWYVGHAPEHYRCYRIFVTQTHAERIGSTVEFFPSHLDMPKTSSADNAMRAARDLLHALQNPTPATPFPNLGDTQLAALTRLAQIFGTAAEQRGPPAKSPKAIEPSPVASPRVPATTPAPSPRVPATTALPSPPRQPYNTRSRAAAVPVHLANNVIISSPTAPSIFPTQTHHGIPFEHMAMAVLDPDTGKAMEYRELIKSPKTKPTWTRSFSNELGRLAQGVGDRLKGTNTIFFIKHDDVPQDRRKDVTYGRIVVDVRPQKAEPERTRLTVGGNLINYPGEVSTATSDLTTAKLVINSVISTEGARYAGVDIKNFYLGTPMERYEYMRLPIGILPDEIVEQYQLLSLVHNGHIYVEIRRGMYGLPQAGILAYKLLVKNLAHHGYAPCVHTPGLWKHRTRPVLFSLVVDDFGVKYVGKQHLQHLIASIQKYYELTVDWEGTRYCGITLEWDYVNKTVDLSMPGYVEDALHNFQHPKPKRATHAPSGWSPPTYGTTVPQLTKPIDLSADMSPEQTKLLQKVVGKFLYYARAVDPTMLHILSTLASAQTIGTQDTMATMTYFLNYAASNPDAKLRYTASDMILMIESDAAYLTEPKARSRAGGHHYLGNGPNKKPILNGPIHSVSKILRSVMSSAAEAEIGGLFHNAKDGTVLRITLHEMGHPQPPTPIATDNSTAAGIMNRTVKQQRSKAIDMRFYWVRDRVDQKQFRIFWAPGATNIADYYTKHHSAKHHQYMRPLILNQLDPAKALGYLRGCVESGPASSPESCPESRFPGKQASQPSNQSQRLYSKATNDKRLRPPSTILNTFRRLLIN
jgi:hypothetical protein